MIAEHPCSALSTPCGPLTQAGQAVYNSSSSSLAEGASLNSTLSAEWRLADATNLKL